MIHSLTPEQYCFRYMWPCAEIRKMRRQINENDYHLLERYRYNPAELPSRDVLIRCFPDASRDIELLGISRNRDPWSRENLTDYWHHYHEGNSPVLIFRIIEKRLDGFVVTQFAREDNQLFQQTFLLNTYDIDARYGDLVYGHAYHAIEKIGS